MTTATMARSTNSSSVAGLKQLRAFLFEELKPSPGRLRASLVRVAGVMLAMWSGYALNLPEVSAIVALAFFASSTNTDETKKVSLGVPPAVLVILIVLSLVLHIFGPEPLVRTIAFIVIIFGSLYLLQTAQQGQVFLLAGVFSKVFLELWDAGYPGAFTQELQFYIMIDLAVGGLCALAVSYSFGKPGKDPVREFRAALAKRYELIARVLIQPNHASDADIKELRAGISSAQDKVLPLLEAASKKDRGIGSQRRLFADLIRLSQLLLHEILVLRADPAHALPSSPALEWASRRSRAIAHMARTGSLIESDEDPSSFAQDLLTLLVCSTVELGEQVAIGRASLPIPTQETKKGFFRADAFTNPVYFRNAASAFAAAFACYCLISGADWSGIGTAVTTCLITSLTTVEQSRQKQSLRIAGAAVGGVLSYFVLIFVLPSGVGIAGLSLVTAFVTFMGSWVFAGGPNLNYAGVQLALCYFLAIFGDSKTPTALTTVRDRVLGIFIGNLAMWLFYDRISPAWTKNSTRFAFADELTAIADMTAVRAQARSLHDLTHSVSRERECFAKAHASLLAMSDASTPAFSSSARNQQKDAPEIRFAEAQLSKLFSLEFVEAETVRLSLPSLSDLKDTTPIAESLRFLASKLRNGECIDSVGTISHQNAMSLEMSFFLAVREAIACVFPAGMSSGD